MVRLLLEARMKDEARRRRAVRWVRKNLPRAAGYETALVAALGMLVCDRRGGGITPDAVSLASQDPAARQWARAVLDEAHGGR